MSSSQQPLILGKKIYGASHDGFVFNGASARIEPVGAPRPLSVDDESSMFAALSRTLFGE